MSIATDEARARWRKRFRLRVEAMARLMEKAPEDEPPTPPTIDDDEIALEIDQDALDEIDAAERKQRERYDAEMDRERREEWRDAIDRDEP